MKKQRKLWFRTKRFGWGWYPASWQGWAVTVAYALLYIVSGILFGACAPTVIADGGSIVEGTLLFISLLILLTASLLAICYRFGERPRWRWG